jgi:hypothetical protein
MSMGRHLRGICPLLLALASGCATAAPQPSYAGRLVADVVAQLGAPHAIADEPSGARYFTWGTSDVIVMGQGAENPDNWLLPRTRAAAASADHLDASQPELLPSIEGGFKPGACTLTIVADWDAARRGWVARRAIRKGAGPGGRCGMRASD